MGFLSIAVTCILTLVLVYCIYRSGYGQVKSIRAITYLGTMGNGRKNYHKASVIGCSGWVKRVIRLEDRLYLFQLDASVTKGDLMVEVLDRDKRILLSLTPINNRGSFFANAKECYRLVIRYRKMDGQYRVWWE